MTEEWKSCFDGYYSVSNRGRVRRERTGRGTQIGRILKPAKGSRGYSCVDLYNGVTHRVINIHRLVAEAFLGPAAADAQVNHLNGVKSDNSVGNLEYVTCSENHRHSFQTGLRVNPTRKLTVDSVIAIRKELAAGRRQTHLAAEYGVTQSTIWAIGRRITWRSDA